MMNTNIQNSATEQFITFLICIAVGMVISILFDIFRIRRRTFKLANFVVHVEDILFWIMCMLIIPAVIYVVNAGEIRGYLIIGIVTGLLIYQLFFSKPVIDVSVPMIIAVKNFMIRCIKVIMKPISLVIFFFEKIINYCLKIVSLFTGRVARKVEYDFSKITRKFKIIFLKK